MRPNAGFGYSFSIRRGRSARRRSSRISRALSCARSGPTCGVECPRRDEVRADVFPSRAKYEQPRRREIPSQSTPSRGYRSYRGNSGGRNPVKNRRPRGYLRSTISMRVLLARIEMVEPCREQAFTAELAALLMRNDVVRRRLCAFLHGGTDQSDDRATTRTLASARARHAFARRLRGRSSSAFSSNAVMAPVLSVVLQARLELPTPSA